VVVSQAGSVIAAAAARDLSIRAMSAGVDLAQGGRGGRIA